MTMIVDLLKYVEFDGELILFLDWEYLLWVNLVQKFKIVDLI